MPKATLYSDGGARGNPGPAAIGYVLKIGDAPPIYGSKYIGETTNNQAEYTALRDGLRHARESRVTEITCYLDSELVVKQVRGEYKVKHAQLKPMYEQVREVLRSFDSYAIHHVPRAKNKKADELVNEALDARA